ncbi:alkyl/aryl-sulfatase [Gordonia sp. (in: high G+C Gram-positive bacteria)]|uniref:alkyl/aryl-sulfatase n=1 Tax=Gordonia sp. (in: high G+C Gram-positive bacteria) TaxID=84139 RepID=UPI003529C727
MTATEWTRRSVAESAAGFPFDDTQDFEDSERGFVARSQRRLVTAADGRVVWDLDAYRFLDDDCPDTAHPSLWRQGQLLIRDGLFEVAPGIYQLRGYDLSVMSVLETDTGVVVVDPLISVETAAAAWALYREHRGDRPVHAVIYTHSHADHFGGVKGVVTDADVAEGRVAVIAPAGFMEHAVAENVFAGTAMTRRAGYMYGAALSKDPAGQIGAGLGQTTSTGEVSLIPPTVDVTHTGQELTVDGLRLVFQFTPGTEAPAEMNFYLPDRRALCTAENTSHTLHNILTIRGAQVRDARAWADYLTETIDLWGDDLDLVFASHHWPTWGRERAVEFLSLQRDLYSYLHDQTLRLLNQGYVGAEIAEMLRFPPALEAAWHTHGYYGSLSHNVKAVYQRYMGWYDGNPAHLWQHPPVEAAHRYVRAMGGADAALRQARAAYDEGDYRWAAELLDRVLFHDPSLSEARELQAATFEQIAYGAENGTWRNAFLAGAHELRHGVFGTPVSAAGLAGALTVPQVFASIAVRVDGPRAWDLRLTVSWEFTDLDQVFVTELRNGTFIHRRADRPSAGGTVVRLTRAVLIGVVTNALDPEEAIASGDLVVTGDPADLGRLMGVLGSVDPDFPIVTPRG